MVKPQAIWERIIEFIKIKAQLKVKQFLLREGGRAEGGLALVVALSTRRRGRTGGL